MVVLARGTEADFIGEPIGDSHHRGPGDSPPQHARDDQGMFEEWTEVHCARCGHVAGHYMYHKAHCCLRLGEWDPGMTRVVRQHLEPNPTGWIKKNRTCCSDSPPQHARDDQYEVLQAKAEAFEDVDADESDEPAERNDTETSSIDDG